MIDWYSDVGAKGGGIPSAGGRRRPRRPLSPQEWVQQLGYNPFQRMTPQAVASMYTADTGVVLSGSSGGGGTFDMLFGDRWYEFWRKASLFVLGAGVGFAVGSVVGALTVKASMAYGSLAATGVALGGGLLSAQTAIWAANPAGTPWHLARYSDVTDTGKWLLYGAGLGYSLGGIHATAGYIEDKIRDTIQPGIDALESAGRWLDTTVLGPQGGTLGNITPAKSILRVPRFNPLRHLSAPSSPTPIWPPIGSMGW